MELQITTLIENMQDDTNTLYYEHGLSLFVEFEGKKILFDTGQSDHFIDNAKKLNKDINQLDYVIGSHGHYDHSGGVIALSHILKRRIPMCVGAEYFHKKYKRLKDGTYRYNGIGFEEETLAHSNLDVVKISEDTTYLTDHIVLFKNFPRTNEYELLNPDFYTENDSVKYLDEFSDEIVMGLVTTKGLVVVAGCSHVGIINILSEITRRISIPIYAVLGGTHLIGASKERMDGSVNAIKQIKPNYVAVSHCTGEEGESVLQKEFGRQFIRNNTGHVFTIFDEADSRKYQMALNFATKKHAGQYRKGGEPFITHPVAVATMLQNKGYGIDVLVAALFHDLLEDTNATEDEIVRIGGEEVLHVVKLVTKEPGYIMSDYISRIKNNRMAFVLKAADRLHNLMSMSAADDKFIRQYLEETREWYLDFSSEIRDIYNQTLLLEGRVAVDLNRLEKNIVDQIKEVQIKLGYVKETVRLYYPLTSLNTMLGTSYINLENARNDIEICLKKRPLNIGEVDVSVHEGRIEFVVPPDGTEYIHNNIADPDFLKDLVILFGKHHCTKQEILDLFANYSEEYVCEQMPEGADFDYVLYFKDKNIDEYYYCVKEEMGHTIYHRFTKEDYEGMCE